MALNPIQASEGGGGSAVPDSAPGVTPRLPNANEVQPATVSIHVAVDALTASVSIGHPDRLGGGDLSMEYILAKWREMGLDSEAFDYDAARNLAADWNQARQPCEGKPLGESVHPPMPGEPGRIEYLVDPDLKFTPVEQGGNIDFRSLNLIKPVKQGQLLARRLPPGKGSPGLDLFGRPVPAPDGPEAEMPKGSNVEVSPSDPNALLASVTGFLRRKDGQLEINECFVVDGSVDYSTGNIVYDQSALIRGDIQDGFTVQVGGALEIGGGVGESKVISGGDVLIKKGLVGGGHGMVTAKGSVHIGFASNQCIRAHGNLTLEKESFNCQLFSRKAIAVYGPLVGGVAMAMEEIVCRVAGNDLGTKTEIEAGMDYILHENKHLLEDKIRELTTNLGKITQRMTRFRESYRVRKRFTSAEAKLMLELRDIQDRIQASLPELEKRKAEIQERIRQGYLREGLHVRVEKKVNPGVVIKVGPECLRIQEEIAGPKVFLYQQGRIKVI